MNILSEPLVNILVNTTSKIVILFSFLTFFSESWENRDLQFIKKIVIVNLSRIVQL